MRRIDVVNEEMIIVGNPLPLLATSAAKDRILEVVIAGLILECQLRAAAAATYPYY